MQQILMLVICVCACACRAEEGMDLLITVNFDKDLGQNFGTLFEGRSANGKLVCGAGFASVYNTYYRGERMKLQFYVRPPQDASMYTMKPLPRVALDSGAYPHDLGDDILVRTWKPKLAYHRFHSDDGQWGDLERDDWPGDSFATVRGKRLEVQGDAIVYDGKQILKESETSGCHFSYYGRGRLYFYRRVKGDAKGKGAIKEVVCVPWSPYAEDLAVDMSKAKAVEMEFVREFPYAWGQLGNEVLSCSNWGGLYCFDGQKWKVLVKADGKTSYQIYSMINYGDRLMMAQYPTGNLISYDGKEVKVLKDWPPLPGKVAPGAREAQTTAIYRGELLVGVWPWSELWRLDPDNNAWVFMQRMFTHPPLHVTPTHAYEEQAKAAGLVVNDLGQRLTALVPISDELLIGTSAKNNAYDLEEKGLDFLTREQRDEYGTMYRLKMAGNLAAVMAWKDQPTNLRFVARNGRMTIFQDGKELASADLDAALIANLPPAKVKWGQGIYGPFTGTIQSQNLR